MCFSATASFALSGTLVGIGAFGIARNQQKEHRLFASIPLLFAAQQAAEGIVWLTFPPSEHELLHRAATLAFLSFAVVIWPIWISLSLRPLERQPARRRVLTLFLALGIIVSVASVLLLMRESPVAAVRGQCIRYESTEFVSRTVGILLTLMYLVPILGPFFVSTLRMSRTIGVTLAASLALSFLLEREALTSVWCFFAAILSVQTLLALEEGRRSVEVPGLSV